MPTPNEAFKNIPLSRICPNPWNPRKRFCGQKFDDLVDSIRQKGVLEPILVRPIADGPRLVSEPSWPNHERMVDYEIIAGERRFRACYQIAGQHGGPEGSTIPAIVKPLSDDEAFAVMLRNLDGDAEKLSLDAAVEVEQRINRRRDKLRRAHLKSVETGSYNVKSGLIYSDLFSSCEKVGDHLINVSEALAGEI